MHPWSRRVLAALVVLFTLHGGVARADSLLFDYVGFDYESPNPNPGMFGEPGSGYVGVGFVPGVFAPLVADTSINEYTYVIMGMSPVSQTFVGPYEIVNYGTGTLTLYEDSKSGGTHGDYGANPPNAVTPTTFSDGTPIMVAQLTNFQFVFNTSDGSGSYEGTLNVTGGTQYGNFTQTQGWQFAGASGNAVNIPPGYAHQIDGQAFLNEPTLAHRISFGALKARIGGGVR